jgi:hypothetical protein
MYERLRRPSAIRWALIALWAVALTIVAVNAQERSGSTRAAYMRGHLADAIPLHDAIARGDLATARTHAMNLLSRTSDVTFPTGSVVYFELLKQSATKVIEARTIEVAGRSASTLLSRCGQCHRAMHVRIPLSPTPEARVGGVVGQMIDHQRAADLLLEGLVSPSESQWQAGAEAFARTRLEPRDMPGGKLAERARVANALLQSLATAATDARRPPDQAQVYGRVLATCARCHQEHASVWGPNRTPPR